MPLHFETEFLNHRLYQRMVENVLLNFNIPVYQFLKKWNIYLFSLEATDTRFFDHVLSTSGTRINPGIPSGVTGQYEIKLWLHDSTNEFRARENSDRIQHELCHAILYHLFGTNTFTSFDKKTNWVRAVHDETKRFMISFWYWSFPFWRKFRVSVIDIRSWL